MTRKNCSPESGVLDKDQPVAEILVWVSAGSSSVKTLLVGNCIAASVYGIRSTAAFAKACLSFFPLVTKPENNYSASQELLKSILLKTMYWIDRPFV